MVGYAVEQLECNEWLEYTVDVRKAGIYSVEIRAASAMHGGMLHLEFDGIDKSGCVSIPGTGGWQEWRSVTVEECVLEPGERVLRLVCDSGRFNLNCMEFKCR